jgi:glycine cleavage system H protein
VKNPDDLLYTKEHIWIRVEGKKATLGITDHAQEELGEVVFAELPEVGDSFDANDAFGNVESVKAVSELFIPVSGEVTGINSSLDDAPHLVNDDAFGKGWLVRIAISDPGELDDLLSAQDYEDFISEGDTED